jgi:hypothetical protein
MAGVRRNSALLAGAALALSVWAAPSAAQADSSGWRFVVTPYLWLAGLDGRVGVGRVATKVDLGPGDILDMLRFGAMASVEARRNAWVFAADGIYVSLGAGHVLAFRGDTGTLNLEEREWIVQPTAGYGIRDGAWALDVVGGLRYWYLRATLGVDPARRPSREVAGSRQWVDATAGFKVRWVPTTNLRLLAAADGGGGGSRGSWQAAGSLGYDPWSRWTLAVAYRALSVNYDRDGFLNRTIMKGFVLGATYRFQ